MVEEAQAMIPSRASHPGRGADHSLAVPVDEGAPHDAIMGREIERLTRRHHEARMRLAAGDPLTTPIPRRG